MRQEDIELNATCEVCGERYHVCKKCILLRNNGIDNWRLHYDKSVCYQVGTTIEQFKDGTLNKNDAKEQLEPIIDEVSVIDELLPVVEDIIGRSVMHADPQFEGNQTIEPRRRRR